jgi:hypothetical protein
MLSVVEVQVQGEVVEAKGEMLVRPSFVTWSFGF